MENESEGAQKTSSIQPTGGVESLLDENAMSMPCKARRAGVRIKICQSAGLKN
jgi:hypothetical protein